MDFNYSNFAFDFQGLRSNLLIFKAFQQNFLQFQTFDNSDTKTKTTKLVLTQK